MNPQVLDLVGEDYADFAGGIYDRPEVERPCRRGAELREAHARALRPDPDPAPLFLRRGGRRDAGPARELCLHDRGVAGLPAGAQARRHALRHALAETAAARHAETLRNGGRGAGGERRRRSRPAARPDPQLEDDHPPRQERAVPAGGDSRRFGSFAAERSFDVAYLSRHLARGGEPLQHPGAPLFLRGGDGPGRA